MKPPRPLLAFAATVACALFLSVAGAASDDPPAPPAPAPSGEPAPSTPPSGTPSSKPAEPSPAEPAEPAEDKAPTPAPPDAAVTGAPGLDADDPRNEEVDATVILSTGERVTGVLIEEKGKSVTIRVGGIPTTFAGDQIDQVQKSAPFRERYKLFSEAAGSDPDQILKVADWLAARERYELALYEVERALAVQPANTEAKQRQVRLTKQLELSHKARRPRETRPTSPDGARSPKRPDAPREEFPLLTPEQVNVLRIYEINLNDPPNMVIERSTVQRLIDTYAGSPLIPVTREGREAFFRKRPVEILDIMFRLRARELYGEVRVLETPESVRRFRDDVERTWLTNACATADCHGGAHAGRLQLATRRSGSDATVATNLLIIDRFRLADGTPLVDFDRPEKSPLLQFALPRTDALRKHPAVPARPGSKADAVKPVFQNTSDRRYQQAVAWMKSMYSPRPDYPITYTPPGQPPAAANAPAAAVPSQTSPTPPPPSGAQPGTPTAPQATQPAGGSAAPGGSGARPDADKTAPSEQPKPR